MAEKRSFNTTDEKSASSVQSRVLSTLLNEMDGVAGPSAGVLIMAATNRADSLDPVRERSLKKRGFILFYARLFYVLVDLINMLNSYSLIVKIV